MIVIASHSIKAGGKISYMIVDNLNFLLKNKDRMIIHHSLYGDFNSQYSFSYNDKKTFDVPFLINGSLVIRLISEIIGTQFILFKNRNRITHYIGLDPLNAFNGLFFKIFNTEVKVTYLVPDYSTKKYENFLLEKIYKTIERFVSKKADNLLCVSKAIFDIKNVRPNVYLFNNYPAFSIVPSTKEMKRNKKKLFMVGYLDDYYKLDELFEAISMLRKSFGVDFYIIGGGKKEEDYKDKAKRLKVDEFVNFVGFMPRDKMLKYISKMGVSLCIYSDNNTFNYYRDSVKIRDSIAVGIPVITTNNHDNSKEVEEFKLGAVINSRSDNMSKDIYEAYEKIINDYDNISERCLLYYKRTYKIESTLNNVLRN